MYYKILNPMAHLLCIVPFHAPAAMPGHPGRVNVPRSPRVAALGKQPMRNRFLFFSSWAYELPFV